MRFASGQYIGIVRLLQDFRLVPLEPALGIHVLLFFLARQSNTSRNTTLQLYVHTRPIQSLLVALVREFHH